MQSDTLIQVEQAPLATIIVQPRKAFWDLELGSLWEYRELLYFLVWRDIKVKYKQTVLGVAWAVLQPLLATLVFSIFFGRLARIPSDGVPYPVFVQNSRPLMAVSSALSTRSFCHCVNWT
jgi:lipopolysaccharide transport system permease protein